jgi:hypothetical protein
MPIRILAASALAVVLSGGLQASEEEFLEWSEVRIVAPERKDTGRVVFFAKTAEAKFAAIQIEAFGKKYEVEKEHLEKLAGFPLHSLATTHEAGYERLGGHTVHFKLKTIQYDPAGRLVEDRVVLSVSRGRGVAVSGPQRHVIKEKSSP